MKYNIDKVSPRPLSTKARYAHHQREYRRNNAEHVSELRKKRYDLEKAKAERDAKKAWLEAGDVDEDELAKLYVDSDGRCKYCGKEVEKVKFWKMNARGFDHVIPRIKGGEHTISNIVVCCQSCNNSKGNKTLAEWEDMKDAQQKYSEQRG